MTLAGFRSRWMMPARAAPEPDAIPAQTESASSTGGASSGTSTLSPSVEPSTSSMTKKVDPVCSSTLVRGPMLGVIDRGKKARLALEPQEPLRDPGKRRPADCLQRDVPMEPRVSRAR